MNTGTAARIRRDKTSNISEIKYRINVASCYQFFVIFFKYHLNADNESSFIILHQEPYIKLYIDSRLTDNQIFKKIIYIDFQSSKYKHNNYSMVLSRQ